MITFETYFQLLKSTLKSTSLFFKKVQGSQMVLFFLLPILMSRPRGIVVKGVSCNIKGPGLESPVRHGCQTVCSKLHQWLSGSALKIGR